MGRLSSHRALLYALWEWHVWGSADSAGVTNLYQILFILVPQPDEKYDVETDKGDNCGEDGGVFVEVSELGPHVGEVDGVGRHHSVRSEWRQVVTKALDFPARRQLTHLLMSLEDGVEYRGKDSTCSLVCNLYEDTYRPHKRRGKVDNYRSQALYYMAGYLRMTR